MHLSQHKLCGTRGTELLLEVKFYLDFHRVTQPWRQTLTNGTDVNLTYGTYDTYHLPKHLVVSESVSVIAPREAGPRKVMLYQSDCSVALCSFPVFNVM